MDCPDCGATDLPETAKFCGECGHRLSDAAGAPRTRINVATSVGSGDATGLEVGAIHGSVQVVNNHVFIGDPSPELLDQVERFKRVSTELPHGDAAAARIPDPIRLPALEARIDSVLAAVRSAEQRGEEVAGVRVGEVRISRVELLLKQAILLKADADQLLLDQVGRAGRPQGPAPAGSGNYLADLDLGELLDGFDDGPHQEKLREAYRLLLEANRLEPTNAEVLLHMAQVVDQLGDNDAETRRILLRVQKLLDPPRNDVERFHLAQATFLSAVAGEHTHAGMLRSARDMFQGLGRPDWVRHCDDLLAAQGEGPAATWTRTPPTPTAAPEGFEPVGQWHAHMSNGGTLLLRLAPDGGMQGVQRHDMLGLDVPFGGQWQFDAEGRVLRLHGIVAGSTPFALQVAIVGEQAGSFTGTGSDGLQYLLARVG